LVLDEVLPTWDFREAHEIRVLRSPEIVYRSLRDFTPPETPITSALFMVRRLPSLISRQPLRGFDQDLPLIQQFIDGGFKLLAEIPGEEVVAGVIARFWQGQRRSDGRFSRQGGLCPVPGSRTCEGGDQLLS
jgi:hypothetical protein